jgi:hypothetical protein
MFSLLSISDLTCRMEYAGPAPLSLLEGTCIPVRAPPSSEEVCVPVRESVSLDISVEEVVQGEDSVAAEVSIVELRQADFDEPGALELSAISLHPLMADPESCIDVSESVDDSDILGAVAALFPEPAELVRCPGVSVVPLRRSQRTRRPPDRYVPSPIRPSGRKRR